jgi:hypothetical protein
MKTTALYYNQPTVPHLYVTEHARVSPGVCGVGGEIWAAWVDPSGETLRVSHGPALTPDDFREAPSVALATGVYPAVGIAVLNAKFYVAWSAPASGIHLSSSVDGRIWSPAITTPAAQASAGVSLTAHDGALYIAFRDDATGRAAIIPWNGAFQPLTPLGVETHSVPALASVEDPLSLPALHVAVAQVGGNIVASRCFRAALGDLAATFREVAGLTGEAVTMTSLPVHHAAGLAVGVVNNRRSTISTATIITDAPFFIVERSDPLSDEGVDLPRLTAVDDELFLGYRDLDGRAVVACYIHACALDPNDPRINQPCDPGVCSLDPRLVCAVQPQHSIRWQAATIDNARKGDLILTPADGIGVIGTLLGALWPPQIYDHMGIMMEDRRVIRHCTESKDRLKEKKYYTGVLVVQGAPTHGLRPDHITYGWPGIIHQTVEDAFYTGLRGPYNLRWSTDLAPPDEPSPLDFATAVAPDFLSMSPDERHALFPKTWESLQFCDPEDNFLPAITVEGGDAEPDVTYEKGHYRYEIMNLPKNPALRKSPDHPDGELFWPIVVRPPVEAEKTFPWIRPLLHRIAEASLSLRAHYRFYSYTRSAIAIDGSKDPPAKDDPYWSTIKQAMTVEDPPQPPPIDPANPLPADPTPPHSTSHTEYISINGVDWAVGTHPMVCSSFVWAAVRKAEEGLGRKIVLEAPGQPLNNLGKPRRPAGSQDGLFRYDEAERRKSGTALHAALDAQVRQTIAEEQSGLASLGADVAAFAAGLAPHVATQNVNAFAVDRAEEISQDLWQNPGDGDAVGPDDIYLNWDPPTSADGEAFHGLYGDHAPAKLVQGAYVWAQDCKYQLAAGMAHVRATVAYTDPITGMSRLVPALVTIGCESGYTDAHGIFSALVGVASVPVKATAWDDVLGVHLRYEGVPALTEGINPQKLELQAPPLWRRRIIWTGETRIYHNPDIGDKQENISPFAANSVLAWDPDVMNNNASDAVKNYMTKLVIAGESVHFDDHYVTYHFDVAVQMDGTVVIDGDCCFFVDGDKQDDQTRHFHDILPLDGSRDIKYEVTHDAFLDSHDYGHVLLTIQNAWAKY